MHALVFNLALLAFCSLLRHASPASGSPLPETDANVLPFQACVDDDAWLPNTGSGEPPTMEALADNCEEAHFKLVEELDSVQNEVRFARSTPYLKELVWMGPTRSFKGCVKADNQLRYSSGAVSPGVPPTRTLTSISTANRSACRPNTSTRTAVLLS